MSRKQIENEEMIKNCTNNMCSFCAIGIFSLENNDFSCFLKFGRLN